MLSLHVNISGLKTVCGANLIAVVASAARILLPTMEYTHFGTRATTRAAQRPTTEAIKVVFGAMPTVAVPMMRRVFTVVGNLVYPIISQPHNQAIPSWGSHRTIAGVDLG